MKLSVVLGTARIGRRSEIVAQYLCSCITEHGGVELSYVDVREELTTFATTRYTKENNDTIPWKDTAKTSDGFIFVIPEYSHSYPGEWKLLMDSLHEGEYEGKTAGIVGVSDGQFGGARAVEQAMLYLTHRGMSVLRKHLFYPYVQNQFDAAGRPKEKETEDRARTFIDACIHKVATCRT